MPCSSAKARARGEIAAADRDDLDLARERGARQQLAVDVGRREDAPANGSHQRRLAGDQRPALTWSLRAIVSSVTATSRIAPVTMKITPEV